MICIGVLNVMYCSALSSMSPPASSMAAAAWFWPWEPCGWGVAAARGAAGVGALVSILVPVVGLVVVAAVLLLLLLEVGAALLLLLLVVARAVLLLIVVKTLLLLLLLAVGAALLLLLLVGVGAALLLLLVADDRGAALHLVAVGAESQQYDTHA
ncbi:hypothetical protein EMCRGX_G026426 [Ephydatia muelleri]